MAIFNPDGSIYAPAGSMQSFDSKDPVHDLFNIWSAETIRFGGTPIYYYEIFIQFSTLDKLYLEDRSKIWSTTPVELFAIYEPVSSQNAQGLFGIDSPDEVIMSLNYQDVLNRLGKEPQVGSRIFTPHKRENWILNQRSSTGFQNWGQVGLELHCIKWQESLSTGEGEVSQASSQNFKLT